MAHPDDGLRPGDVCRHQKVALGRDEDTLKWSCQKCGHEWLSVAEPGRSAVLSYLFPNIGKPHDQDHSSPDNSRAPGRRRGVADGGRK